MDKFHFLYPDWLFLFIPFIGVIWLLRSKKHVKNPWSDVIEPQLLNHLLIKTNQSINHWSLFLFALSGCIAIIAMADPVWEKKPQMLFQTPQARVIVFDLSNSMNATDLKPSRLIRARLKIQDILNHQSEGQTGLVVFAGDAFSVTPLTRDNKTISSQLRVLQPNIMPVQGSRLDLGLLKAKELLEQASIHAGDILVIADGYKSSQTITLIKKLHDLGHRISILGVGTPEGAPISNGQGDVIRDNQNKPVLAKLNETRLQALAQAGGGLYSRIRPDNADIDFLLDQPAINLKPQTADDPFKQSLWKENGPYLTILLLPLAALAFRRGWLFSVLLTSILLPYSPPSTAFSWNDLWQTPDQQASQALQQNRFEQAASLSNNPAITGSALYKQEKFDQALNYYQQLNDSDADYNLGNTLAKLGQYKKAIEAYKEALKKNPDMQDAIENKATVEALLKKKEKTDSSVQQKSSNTDQGKNQQKNNTHQKPQKSGQKKEHQSSSQNPSQNQSSTSEEQQAKQSSKPQMGKDNQFSDANNAMQDHQKNEASKTKEKNQQQSMTSGEDKKDRQKPQITPSIKNQPLNQEEKQAAEQWLRRIPDDPGGLLKRKFLYQYQQRDQPRQSRQAW